MSARTHHLTIGGAVHEAVVVHQAGAIEVRLDGAPAVTLEVLGDGADGLVVQVGGRVLRGAAVVQGGRVRVSVAGRVHAIEIARGGERAPAEAAHAEDEVRAPMSGTVIAVHVRPGDVVEPGAPLVTIEAMKMEHRLRAPRRARVVEVLASEGQAVDIGVEIVRLEDAG